VTLARRGYELVRVFLPGFHGERRVFVVPEAGGGVFVGDDVAWGGCRVAPSEAWLT
jgi:hypothetical protein